MISVRKGRKIRAPMSRSMGGRAIAPRRARRCAVAPTRRRVRCCTIETTEAGSCSSTTVCTSSTMRVSGIFPSRNAITATSFAAFITAGNVEPEATDAVGEVDGRERLAVDRLERERALGERHGLDAGRAGARARPARAGSAGACRARPSRRAGCRRGTRPSRAPAPRDGSARGSRSTRGRTGSAPRSPRGPCS